MEKRSSASRAIVVAEGENPSADFFVLPALKAAGFQVVSRSFREIPAPQELDGATIVFVRYVPSAWMRLVEEMRHRLGRLIFFMDDDVLDVGASAGMPLRYRFKLARLAGWRKGWLQRQGADLWVSTPHLQHKYAHWHPQLVLPSPRENTMEVRRVFYHGSASHRAEILWLRPVIEEALRRDECLAFEIIGGKEVYDLYRGLPRVTVVHPMKWPAYRTFLSLPGRHVGLAPLLAVPFNQARSYTKFFDITCCGAVGIYPPDGVFAEVVRHGENGLVVELDQECWTNAILSLASDEAWRTKMLRHAEDKLVELSDKARNLSCELSF